MTTGPPETATPPEEGGNRTTSDANRSERKSTSGVSQRTLYMLSPPATDSWDSMVEDAERRARERGCVCVRPTFLHFLSGDVCTTVVNHAAWCPLSGVAA